MNESKVTPGEVTRNFYRKQGAGEERERIIKLLPELLSGDENGLTYCYECNNWQKLLPDAIELIKGEAE